MVNIIDLNRVLNYFEKLSEVMGKIFPEEITWDNVMNYNYDLKENHPEWVKAHFSMVIIYHREKAGKLRNSKNEKIMFQNNYNVLAQTIWTADDFGIHHRKNIHKGWKNIIAALKATPGDFKGIYSDRQPGEKYKNFEEFLRLRDPQNLHLKALCDVLDENYNCDSIGQLRLL